MFLHSPISSGTVHLLDYIMLVLDNVIIPYLDSHGEQ